VNTVSPGEITEPNGPIADCDESRCDVRVISNEQPAKARALGMELKAARERAGLRTRDAAFKIGSSPATVNRSEKAKRFSPVEDVSAMLAIYGVTGPDRARIMDLVAGLDAPHWLESGDKELPRLLPALRHFEAMATKITQFSPAVVPGLLQTPAYIRALMNFSSADDQAKEEQIAARLDRQAILNKIVSPRYAVFLDEGALRRPCGGAEVMVHQLQWLIGRAEQAHISVRVIPFKHGFYENAGAFTLFEFREDDPIVYIESSGAAGFLHAPYSIAKVRRLTRRLDGVALGSADSVNFLARTVADYERS
jgi:transcriptional regulator with XRE-family HTH domain